MAYYKSLSLDRPPVYVVCAVLVGSIGCSRTGQGPEKAFLSITPGMTVAEVEQILGPGNEVNYEELPQFYRTVLEMPRKGTAAAKGAGVVYRKWSRSEGETIAIGYIAFWDDKVVEQTVYTEITRKGKK